MKLRIPKNSNVSLLGATKAEHNYDTKEGGEPEVAGPNEKHENHNEFLDNEDWLITDGEDSGDTEWDLCPEAEKFLKLGKKDTRSLDQQMRDNHSMQNRLVFRVERWDDREYYSVQNRLLSAEMEKRERDQAKMLAMVEKETEAAMNMLKLTEEELQALEMMAEVRLANAYH